PALVVAAYRPRAGATALAASARAAAGRARAPRRVAHAPAHASSTRAAAPEGRAPARAVGPDAARCLFAPARIALAGQRTDPRTQCRQPTGHAGARLCDSQRSGHLGCDPNRAAGDSRYAPAGTRTGRTIHRARRTGLMN